MGSKVFFVVFGFAFLVAGFFLFAPESRVESVKESWRRMSGDPGQICLDHYRPSFVDPESVRVLTTRGAPENMWITFTVGNRAGGRAKVNRACTVNGGKVDEHSSKMNEAIATMEAQNLCIQRSIAAIEEARRTNRRGFVSDECTQAAAIRTVRED